MSLKIRNVFYFFFVKFPCGYFKIPFINVTIMTLRGEMVWRILSERALITPMGELINIVNEELGAPQRGKQSFLVYHEPPNRGLV